MSVKTIVEHTQFANIVVRAAIEHQGKYLLVQEAKKHVEGRWAFPGGKVEVGEFLLPAAVREIEQETGVVVELTGILGVQYVLWDDRPGFTLEVQFVGTCPEVSDSLTSEEILSTAWYTLEEIDELRAAGKLRNRGHEAIYGLIKEGHTLPITSLVEHMAGSPKVFN